MAGIEDGAGESGDETSPHLESMARTGELSGDDTTVVKHQDRYTLTQRIYTPRLVGLLVPLVVLPLALPDVALWLALITGKDGGRRRQELGMWCV